MRKLVASLFLSLDGVMEAPEKWNLPYFNDEMGAAIGEAMSSTGAFLLGRRTYQEWAEYWPNQPTDGDPFSEVINNTPKFVVSTTLDEVSWENSTLVRGGLAAEVTKLKQQPGKNISVSGSGTLVRSLLREGLLDELRLMIHPVRARQREAPVRGRDRSDFARAGRVGDVQHRRPQPHLPTEGDPMSAKSVAKKLQIKPAATVWSSHPEHLELIEPLPKGVRVVKRPEEATAALLFGEDAASLREVVAAHADRVKEADVLWVAYPKGNRSDINRDSVWPIVAEYGLGRSRRSR